MDHPIKILLVDDQPIVFEAVSRMLAGETDMELRYCADPAMAVPEALKFSPTVILQDLIMPDIDGLTLVKWYRAHPKLKDIPLIVLSSREEPATKAEAFASGANDYLVKLPDGIELIARIRYHSRAYIALLERNEAYEALTADLAQAAEYVMSLLPKPVADGSVTTEWRFIPCAQLGGDSLGYHWIDPENFAIYLLDVTGHGVGAALFSVSALEAIRTHSLPGVDFRVPEDVLRAMNQFFPMQQHNDLFLTCWYGVYHLPDRRLRYASGGHPRRSSSRQAKHHSACSPPIASSAPFRTRHSSAAARLSNQARTSTSTPTASMRSTRPAGLSGESMGSRSSCKNNPEAWPTSTPSIPTSSPSEDARFSMMISPS
jgi:sigma-B regulation protein RsbU (phosphoserine phosphatase)